MSDPNHTEKASTADVELFDFYVAQLEAYLDGELAGEEAVQVRRRLMQEEAYAAALGRLHAQRVQRLEVFRNIERQETDDLSATRLVTSARQLAARRTGSWPTWTKVVFGMAACLLVGFGAGWIGFYDLGEEQAIPNPRPYQRTYPQASGQWIYVDQSGVPQMSIPATGRPFEATMPEDSTLQLPPH